MNGVINIYKEKGYSSHDAVAVVKGVLKEKAGHTGTLDPMAEGVLPVCVGRATKLSDYIMAGVKQYRANMILGAVTDTQDSYGRVLQRFDVNITREQLEECALSFQGIYSQSPPMYSAVKVKGRRLYELAREGVTIERAPRPVEIYRIRVVEFISDNEVVIDVLCGKGTYIRTLCADIGEKLGCGGHMGELLRVRSGKFTLDSAVTLEKLKTFAQEGRVGECIIPIETVLSEYKSARVKEPAEKYLYNGNKLHRSQLVAAELPEGELLTVYDSKNELAALYRCNGDELKCEVLIKIRGTI